MKLANALSERSQLQTRLRQLETRLLNNAKVQEGEEPAEDPQALLKELREDYGRLEELISRINRTNSTAMVGEKSLSDLLAHRDCLNGRIGILRNFLNEASALAMRHSAQEIRLRSTVSVREMQKELDQLSRELREVDEIIQEKNWTTEVN